MDHNLSDWHTTDILVKVKETHDDPDLIYQTGVIRSISVSYIYNCIDHFKAFAAYLPA